MKQLFIATAVIEFGAGLALLCRPSAAVTLLLGSELDTPAAVTIGRVTGAALLALGVACWLARRDERSRTATGLAGAMLLYNAAVVVILAFAGIGLGLRGVGLWPAVVLHAVLAAWYVVCLRRGRVNVDVESGLPHPSHMKRTQ